MIRKMFHAALALVLVVASLQVQAQKAKDYFKSGETFLEARNYNDAIEHLTKAIELEPDYTDAYLTRAKAYRILEKINQAADDYKRAAIIEEKDYELFYQAAGLYYKCGDFQQAVDMLNKSTELKDNRRNEPAFELKTKALLALEKYQEALEEAQALMDLRNRDEPQHYFLRGQAFFFLKNYASAEKDFEFTTAALPNHKQAHIFLAQSRFHLKKYDKAMAAANKAIALAPKSTEAYLVRSQIHKAELDYPSAINDLSRITVITPDDPEVFFTRGEYYQEFNKHQDAINDFSRVLALNDTCFIALAKRAQSYEKVTNYENAIKDYNALLELGHGGQEVQALLDNAKKRLFELNRESNAPKIVILAPKPVENDKIEVRGDADQVKLQLKIEDQSDIASLKINGKETGFNKDSIRFGAQLVVPLQGKEDFAIRVVDVYDNEQAKTFYVKRTEINPPVVELISPYPSDNGEIFLDSDDPNLFVSGKIKDESLIKSIYINGATASFLTNNLNPEFSANININNINTLKITATDIYGNEQVKEYTFNRSDVGLMADNPMGRTWVIFIENSEYTNFASLDGPKEDVRTMKSALAKYKIHKVIHKRNMTKRQLARFFSIQLRDMVRNNRVNSLLVWYAGHGKFINETGYWIPVDAKRDDEFSYFNINSLKASMQSYSKYITHTLVISDACESGPSFYQAMRSELEERSCNDVNATKFKSSQVFTSAGYELALDKSQFTKTFASSLNYNANSCIPIESIVIKVTKSVSQNTSQKPKFGKISGFEDEGGTFFFIKKE